MIIRKHQTLCKMWERIREPDTDSENIPSRFSDGIWRRIICYDYNEKRKMTEDGRNRIAI